METTETNEVQAPLHYNPNQLVTYKVIDIDDTYATTAVAHYPTVKVTELEWELEQGRRQSKRLNQYVDKVAHLESRLAEYLEMDSEEIVADICSIFGFNPTKDIEFEISATITGTINIPLADVADFDINDVDFNISIDTYSHDISDYNVDVDNVITL